jgi:hypothetical protein
MVHLPAPTAWPMVLAFGFSLVFAGLLTSFAITLLGAVLTVAGCVGWFCAVLPHEKHEEAPVLAEVLPAVTERREVKRVEIRQELHRARLPLEIYPISAGIKGGLAGSVSMAACAMLYGLIAHRSLWYPINLLAAVVYRDPSKVTMTLMEGFHIELLVVATLLHLTTSLLMGLLYGAMLPMFPRRPILLGGLIAPLMWTGLLYSGLGIINPVLDKYIDWRWFVASQIAYGVTAGLVVARQERIRTFQFMPFAARMGMEAPGVMHEKKEGEE